MKQFYFSSQAQAWEFAKQMVALGRVVVDYGMRTDKLLDGYFIRYYITLED